MLSGAGFGEVINVRGGIESWQGRKAAGPVEMSMEMIRGDEAPDEILALGYWLEKGLQRFYLESSYRTDSPESRELLLHLAGIENRHIQTFFSLLESIDPGRRNPKAFEEETRPKMMEGGFDIEDFMKQNAPHLKSVQGILDLAMMLETQALDLYLRFGHRITHPQTTEVLFKIADEEKAHLASLGKLLEYELSR